MTATVTALTTLVVAVVAAIAGYYFRSREWLTGQRLIAYSSFIAALDNAVTLRLIVYSTYVQLGDAMYTDAARREEARPLLESTTEPYNAYRRATDDVVLIASESAL